MGKSHILVNGTLADTETILHTGDKIEYALHCHEPPVLAHPGVNVIGFDVDSGLLAVFKPPTVPVHPTGRFVKNSVADMLRSLLKFPGDDSGPFHTCIEALSSLKLNEMTPVHRLDRLTSGVLLFGTSKAATKTFHRNLASDSVVKKLYLARVRGVFQGESCVERDEPTAKTLGLPPPAETASTDWYSGRTVQCLPSVSDTMTVNEPLVYVKYKDRPWARPVLCASEMAQCKSESGMSASPPKPSVTLIRRIAVLRFAESDGGEVCEHSLVLCRPLTGRKHQIRAHLASQGFPIANDPLYTSDIGHELSVSHVMAEKLVYDLFPDFTPDAMCERCDHPLVAGPSIITEREGLYLHAMSYWSDRYPRMEGTSRKRKQACRGPSVPAKSATRGPHSPPEAEGDNTLPPVQADAGNLEWSFTLEELPEWASSPDAEMEKTLLTEIRKFKDSHRAVGVHQGL